MKFKDLLNENYSEKTAKAYLEELVGKVDRTGSTDGYKLKKKSKISRYGSDAELYFSSEHDAEKAVKFIKTVIDKNNFGMLNIKQDGKISVLTVVYLKGAVRYDSTSLIK